MALLLITLLFWTIILFFLRPTPSDLQTKMPGYWVSFKKIKMTFWLGLFLITTFFIFSGGTFDELNENWLLILGVNNLRMFTPWWFVQAVTHNFIHMNWLHLWTNLSFLGILSLYERNVQARRFLIVFLLSGTLSSISILFMPSSSVSAGASSGLFGLAAAYLLDTPKLTIKEYFLGFSIIIILFCVLSYTENKRSAQSSLFAIDTVGHVFGLIFGAIFCRLFPRKVVTS